MLQTERLYVKRQFSTYFYIYRKAKHPNRLAAQNGWYCKIP